MKLKLKYCEKDQSFDLYFVCIANMSQEADLPATDGSTAPAREARGSIDRGRITPDAADAKIKEVM